MGKLENEKIRKLNSIPYNGINSMINYLITSLDNSLIKRK